MKPIIGIIGRPHKTNTDKNIICTFEDYRNAVCKFGGIPISILPTQILQLGIIYTLFNSTIFTQKTNYDIDTTFLICYNIFVVDRREYGKSINFNV